MLDRWLNVLFRNRLCSSLQTSYLMYLTADVRAQPDVRTPDEMLLLARLTDQIPLSRHCSNPSRDILTL